MKIVDNMKSCIEVILLAGAELFDLRKFQKNLSVMYVVISYILYHDNERG